MIELKTYEVHYTKKNGKTGVYHTECALCPDGAEEAALLTVKGIQTIDKIVEIIN
jgi:hypothetical protein